MTSEVRDDVCDWPLELLKDYTSICEDNEYGNAFTFQEPQQEPLPQANTIDEWDPFEGQIFNNDDEAYEFYSVFARKNGFSIRRDHSYKSRKNESGDNPLGVYKREFVCHRAGIVKQRKVNDVESQRKRKYLLFRWRRESSLIPKCSHIVNHNGSSHVEFKSLIQCLEVESLKTKEREQAATKELEKVIRQIKCMPESQDNLIDLEPDVPNNDGSEVENPPGSKTKGRPKRSRPKGGVEVAKKPRYCQVPNCGRTDHDARNCPNKKKSIEVLPSQSPIKITKGWRQSSSNI